jgi:energy-coupling factor transporter transmembrane protein EcfT
MNCDHLLTRLDPRVKLISTLALLVMVISTGGLSFRFWWRRSAWRSPLRFFSAWV